MGSFEGSHLKGSFQGFSWGSVRVLKHLLLASSSECGKGLGL